MRKILLGTTAVVGAALLGPTMAQAQEAPTVRIGGYFRAAYGYVQQSGAHSDTSTGGSGLPTDVSGGTSNIAGSGTNMARLGKHDFSTDAEIHVFVNGKLANGLTYGAVIEIEFDQQEGRNIVQQRASTGKTTAALDEMWAFIAHPSFGQIRFGDEDGALALMQAGWISNFGSGGVHGWWESFVTRQRGARTTTTPDGIGDNTKIVYLSPQFFGFDFGASFALNANTGEDVGCPNNSASGWCDRAYAFAGASNFGIYAAGPEQAARRNEYQIAARWRGQLGPVGLAISGGYLGSGAARDITTAGGLGARQVNVFNGLNVWTIGAQATAYGFTLGAAWVYGDYNFFWDNTFRGDQKGNQYTIGASYTAGPFTVGANYVFGTFAGGSARSIATTGPFAGSLVQNLTSANNATMRRYGWGIGANYRLAPGLDLIAEFVQYRVREGRRDLDPVQPGVQTRADAQVFILGTRLAF
ncbi:MAG TPA: porin [Acetobacteraceae bacterium]|nr:porin [Acetobacteraceae bacterium]